MVQVSNNLDGELLDAGSVPVSLACGCASSTLARLLSPRLFKALSDPTRLALFMRLVEQREPLTVGQIATGSGVDLSVVSRHLAALRDAGVIKCDKQGKEVWCRVRTAAVTQILRDLADALETCCPEGLDSSSVAPGTMSEQV